MKLYSLAAVCFSPVESGCPVRLNSIRQLSETWLSPGLPAGSPYSGFLASLARLLELRKFSFYLECVVYGNPLRGRGVALGSLGRYDEAVRDFDRSLELDPGNAETLAAKGLAHTSLEQHEQAIEDYSRVLDLDPRATAVLYSRGIARMYVARFESAIEDFEAIIGIEPGNGAALAARELAREALGKRGGAGEGQAAR